MPQKRRDWRKISTDAVEEALDTQHVQRDLAAKDLADELFEIDTSGASKRATKRERRGQVSFAKKPLPVLDSDKKNHLKKNGKIEKYMKKLQARKEVAVKAAEAVDIWDGKEDKKLWCGQSAPNSGIRVSGKMEPHQKPKSLDYRPNCVPALSLAHSGQSINPKQENYNALVSEAAAVEMKKELEQETLYRSSHGMTADLIDRYGKEAVKSMSQEEKLKLFLGEAPEEQPAEIPVKKANERKTITQRNKEAKHKALMEAMAKSKKEEKFQKSLGNVGAVVKALREEDELKAQKEELQKKKKAHELELEKQGKISSKIKVGKFKFEEPDLEAAQPRNDEEGVKTSIRRAHALMGSAVRDRMHSILRRKMLPANPNASTELLAKAKLDRYHKKKLRKFCHPAYREAIRDGKVKKSKY